MFHLKISMKWKYRCRATGKQTWTQIMKKNLYNTPVGVRKWMREFRELNVDVGFETKKMKMERTRMLSSEGYIYISLDKSSSSNLLISVVNFFKSHIPLLRKRPHIEKYFPFPRYKIKPTNGSECTIFNFDCHIDLLAPSKQM